MKIVVLDSFTLNPGDLSWEELSLLGDLKVYDRTKETEIATRIGDAEIVITNKTPISKETLEACRKLQFISVLATGYNVIDVKEARKRGIMISNVPAYGSYSVAQFAISLLLEICSQVGAHNKSVHEGKWTNSVDWCYWDTRLIELLGKTMGIIGYGRIGQTTGRIAKSLGMKVIVNSRHKAPDNPDVEYVLLDELYKRSDVIVLHCSLNEDNYQFMNKEAFNKMKKGAILINNARGQLVNEQDLADALNNDHLLAAGIDVVSTEPMSKDNPLLTAKNCYITPHMSWGFFEARSRIMTTTCENVKAFLDNQWINRVDC